MARANRVDALLTYSFLDRPLLGVDAKSVTIRILRDTTIYYANLVIVSFYRELFLLEVLVLALTNSDIYCHTNFWQGVFLRSCWLQPLIVLLDSAERFNLLVS